MYCHKKNDGLPSPPPPQNVTILRSRVFTEVAVRAGRFQTSIANVPKGEERDRQVTQSKVMKTREVQREACVHAIEHRKLADTKGPPPRAHSERP